MKRRHKHNKRRRDTGYVNGWLGVNNTNIKLILLLVFALPIGLLVMWSRECEWNRYIKSSVSLGVVALILSALILLPPLPEARLEGGVNVLSYMQDAEMLAPLKPTGIPDTAQALRNPIATSMLITEPTPTPVPIKVYCNDNGRYYHMSGCRYVYDTTPYVTLLQALNAGKTACPDCNPPKEVLY